MLNNIQIAQVKGMLARGDKQHDIAAHFAVNSGRIAEIATGKVGNGISPASARALPTMPPVTATRRFFAPGQSLEEQIATFDSLAKQGPFDVARAHYISPELAEYILQHNTKNRPKRTGNIERWADAMQDDAWGLTGQTLIFSKPPVRLLDGQHRLASCVKAGVGFKAFIVFGIDRGEFTKIDTGARKTNGDALAWMGVKDPSCMAAAIRWLYLLDTNPWDRTTLENEAVVERYKALDKSAEAVVLADFCAASRRIVKSSKKDGRTFYTPGQLAGVLYFLHRKDEKATARFVALLESNKGAADILRKRLNKIIENGGRIHDVGRAGMIIKAWKAAKESRVPTTTEVFFDATADDAVFPSV